MSSAHATHGPGQVHPPRDTLGRRAKTVAFPRLRHSTTTSRSRSRRTTSDRMSGRGRSVRFARTERERTALPLAPSVGQSRSPPLADIIGARRVITKGWDEMPSFAIGLIVSKAVIQRWPMQASSKSGRGPVHSRGSRSTGRGRRCTGPRGRRPAARGAASSRYASWTCVTTSTPQNGDVRERSVTSTFPL